MLKLKDINKLRDMKQTIKLNESQLKKIVVESVKRVLKESVNDTSVENILINLGFVPYETTYFSDFRRWISPEEIFGQNNYVISLYINGKWYHSTVLNMSEKSIFKYAEKITNKLQGEGWQPMGYEDPLDPENSMDFYGYSDVGYIDRVVIYNGEIEHDLCSSFIVHKNGIAFWDD